MTSYEKHLSAFTNGQAWAAQAPAPQYQQQQQQQQQQPPAQYSQPPQIPAVPQQAQQWPPAPGNPQYPNDYADAQQQQLQHQQQFPQYQHLDEMFLMQQGHHQPQHMPPQQPPGQQLGHPPPPPSSYSYPPQNQYNAPPGEHGRPGLDPGRAESPGFSQPYVPSGYVNAPQAGAYQSFPAQGGGAGGSGMSLASTTALHATPIAERPPLHSPEIVPVAPKYMSLCVNAMPSSKSTQIRSGLTLGVVLHPLAETNGPPLPVINFGEIGVLRCKQCRAYINPYVVFSDGGKSWRCNMCYKQNETPANYYAPLDRAGVRIDLQQRAELRESSIEIIAPVEYMVRQPMPPVFVFLVDVSQAAVRSGIMPVVAATIKQTLDRLPGAGTQRTMFGLITYDSMLHYYAFRPTAKEAQMLVMPDLDDIFLPLPDYLLVNIDENRMQIDALLDSLPDMHRGTQDPEVALGPALDAANRLMGRVGGKLQVFCSGLPSIGRGRLANRENTKLLNTEKEISQLLPVDKFYQDVAEQFTRNQICCDLFLFSHQYTDVASLSQLSKFTGGQVNYYPRFDAQRVESANKLAFELARTLTRHTAWEAVIRIRCSQGAALKDYQGSFSLRAADLLALPTTDSDKAFAVGIVMDETAVINEPSFSIQAALLYTSSTGERRIRVHTACLPVTSHVPDLYTHTNLTTMTSLIAKQAITKALQSSFPAARELITQRCMAVLQGSKAMAMKFGPNPAADAAIASLPLMTLGLIKNITFREGNDVRVDLRASVMRMMETIGVVEMESFVRPRLIPVHYLPDAIGLPEPTSQDAPPDARVIVLPEECALSVAAFSSDGIFLLDNHVSMYLRVGRRVDPAILRELFGVQSLDRVASAQLSLRQPAPGDEASLCARLRNIIVYLRNISSYYQELTILIEGDARENEIFQLLIEDRYLKAPALAEFNRLLMQ